MRDDTTNDRMPANGDEPSCSHADEMEDLRNRAQKKRQQDVGKLRRDLGQDHALLIHELEVLQVELAMQNEELRRTESEVARSQRKYLDLFDLAPVGYLTLSAKNLILEVNLAAAELLGVPREDLIGRRFDRYVSVDDADRFYLHQRQARKEVLRRVTELRMRREEGEEFCAQLITMATKGDAGEPDQLRIIVADITASNQMEETYRALVDHSLQGLVIFQDGKVAFVNQAMAEIAGYTIDEMLAMSVEQVRGFVHPEDREMVWENHRTRLAGESLPERYEMRGVRKDGSVCWLEIHASSVDYRGKPAIQAAYIDITERKRAVEALRLSEERYRGIFENAILGMYQTTPEGEILAANPALVRMLGYETLEELASRNLEHEGFEPEYPRSLVKERLETDDDVVGLESAWRRRDGSTLWVRESARAVRDEAGKILFYEGTVEDICESKHAERLMQTLATAAMELVELPVEGDLFRFVSEKVLSLIGTGIVSVNSIEGDTLTVRQIAGATSAAMKLAQRLLGKAVVDMPLKGVHETARTSLLTGKLAKVEGGLYELFLRTVPHPACWMLEKGLGITECHSIGLRRPGKLLGNVTILAQKGTELNAEVIEAFVNQASIALERRTAVETLLSSEERYRRLVTTATEGIFVLDQRHRFSFANDRMAAMLGYTPQEVLGKPAESVIFAQEMADHNRQVSDRRQGKKGIYERRLVRKDGVVIWGLVSAVPILDARGEFDGSLGMVTDITERKEAEQELRETMRLNQILLDAMPCVALLLRTGTRQVVASNEAARAVGAVVGMTCFGTWARRSTPCPWCLAPEVWATGQARHLVVEYEGVVWDAHWVPIADDLYMHYAFDITERRRAEEEVRRQLDELRRWHDVTIRREERVAELKREVNALTARLGEPSPYQSENEPCPEKDH